MSFPKKTKELSPIFKKINLGYSLKKKDFQSQENIEKNSNITKLEESKDIELLNSNRLKGYSKIQELKLINIRLASSQKILEWAEKVLPNGKIFGEVLNANTLHYKTFKPHKGGLFCERIFGPLKDFECACGIKQKPSDSDNYVQTLLNTQKAQRNFCPNCDVEYTWSVIRRYQLGYIKLISPVSHLWYLKTNPSYLSLLLDIRKKDLESIIYCIQITTLEYYWKPLYSIQLNLNPSALFMSYKNFFKTNRHNQMQKFKRKKIKKKTERLKNRKEIFVRRQSMYFTSSKINPFEFLERTSLQTKIAHLEKSYQLSTTDAYLKTLEKFSILTRFLKEKMSQKVKKYNFFVSSKKNSEDFYQQNAHLCLYYAFTTFEKFNGSFNIDSNRFIDQSPKTLKTSFKKSLNVTNINSPFTYLLKKHLDSKPKRIKNNLNSIIIKNQGSDVLDFSLKIKSREFKSFVLNFKDKDLRLTLKNKNLSRKTFLSYFLKFVRLMTFNSVWTSIYDNQNNSVKFLLNIIISKPTLTLDNEVGKFFKTCFVLYFLYMIQETSDSFLKQDILKPNNFNHIKRLLTKLKSNNQNSSVFLGEIVGLTEFQEESLESESKLFTKNFLSELSEKSLLFFKINDIINDSTNELILFTNLFMNKFIRIFLELKSFAEEEVDVFKRSNSRLICLLQLQINNPVIYPFKESEEFLKNSYISSLSETPKTRRDSFFEKLKQDKKIYSFMNAMDFSCNTYTLYLKNKIQIIRNLKILTTHKVQIQKNLSNRIYTLSYAKGWETEREWKYFLYYNTNPIEISDKLQFYYKTCFESSLFFNNINNVSIPIIGANLIQNLLFQYEGNELKKIAKQHQNILPKFNRYIRNQKQISKTKVDFMQLQKLLQKRDQFIRRLKLLRKLYRKNSKTSSMILKTLPVLPPDLRPILKLQNQIAASDLNRFYQRIIYRNDRLKKFLKMNSVLLNSEPGFEIKYGQRLLQEAVDNLIQNGKGSVTPETNSRGQPLKSLSEILKGKQGRFRQYLLGKRVDYSGRSVIVVGPSLKIYQCGLPFEMAMELFLPFLIKRIFQYQLARTVVGAKTILKTQKKMTWDLLEEIMYNHPILLNRAPTLHRLGIQAFQPKLIEGRAILLHPLVCPAFNADFDGDQMAVHLPITVEARTEAWKLMLSRNHLISPATGEPMLLPSQDMVLGCYYLTTETFQYSRIHSGRPFLNSTRFYFSNMNEILQHYLQEKIHLQTPIWLKWNSQIQFGGQISQPLEIRLESNGYLLELRPQIQKRSNAKGEPLMVFIRTTAGRVIFNKLVETITKN